MTLDEGKLPDHQAMFPDVPHLVSEMAWFSFQQHVAFDTPNALQLASGRNLKQGFGMKPRAQKCSAFAAHRQALLCLCALARPGRGRLQGRLQNLLPPPAQVALSVKLRLFPGVLRQRASYKSAGRVSLGNT